MDCLTFRNLDSVLGAHCRSLDPGVPKDPQSLGGLAQPWTHVHCSLESLVVRQTTGPPQPQAGSEDPPAPPGSTLVVVPFSWLLTAVCTWGPTNTAPAQCR